MQCVNTNTREYQTLLKLSGLSDFELETYVGEFLDTLGRYPYLDELPKADSSKAISEDLSLNKDNITKTENILLATNTNTVEEAVPILNDKYRDKEIEILEVGSKSKVYVTTRPNTIQNQDGETDKLIKVATEIADIKERAIANGTFMLAPNGKPTHLTEQLWLQVRTKNFINWFGDWLHFNKMNPYSTNIHLGEWEDDFSSSDASGLTKVLPIYLDNEWIGEFSFDNKLEDNSPYLNMPSVGGNNVSIEEEYRGKGYGKAAYFEIAKLAANNGKILRSAPDNSRTPASTRVWNSFIRDGYAKKAGDRYEFINSSLNDASKVVDENGEPLVVWHSGNDTYSVFNLDKSPNGFYFGTQEQTFARADMEVDYVPNGMLIQTFLNIRNPKITTFDDRDINKYKATNDGFIIKVSEEDAKKLASIGNYNPDNFKVEYVAFNSNQIKSATDNNGLFSSFNDNINDDYKNVNSFAFFNEIIDKLQTLYGINIIPITNAELSQDRWASITGTKGVKSFIYNGNIYINTDIATIDSPVHEFLHLLFGSMKYLNRALYDLLVGQAELFDSYNTISQNYPNRTRGDINEEVFVTELARYLTGLRNAISNLAQAIQDEIIYNVNRTLDTVLMGENSVKCVENPYIMNLKTLAKLVNSSTMISEKRGSLTDATLNRMMANTKSELMRNKELREECR